MTRKNYRIKDLLLDNDSMLLLNEVSDALGIRNSDLARLLLVSRLKEIKAEGFDNYSLGIIGIKSKKRKLSSYPKSKVNYNTLS